jgi:hypothetical protein
MRMENITRKEQGDLTEPLGGAKKVGKKGPTKIWKKKLLRG